MRPVKPIASGRKVSSLTHYLPCLKACLTAPPSCPILVPHIQRLGMRELIFLGAAWRTSAASCKVANEKDAGRTPRVLLPEPL